MKSPQLEAQLPGGIGRTQLAEWKTKYPEGVFTIDVIITATVAPVLDADGNVITEGVPEEKVTAWFKQPDLQAITDASKFAETEPIKAGVILFESCYLGGDKEVKERDNLKASCFGALMAQFEFKATRVKNW